MQKDNMQCAQCGAECQLGVYINYDNYNMLSIETNGKYISLGIHYSNKEFSGCSYITIDKKMLLEEIAKTQENK